MTAARSPHRPRGKWHLLTHPGSLRTICDELARGWDTAPRADLDPRSICANCLRDTA